MSLTMKLGGKHISTLLLMAVLIDIFTGLSQEDRNEVLKALGISKGTWVNGRRLEHKGCKYKIQKTRSMAMFNMYQIPGWIR